MKLRISRGAGLFLLGAAMTLLATWDGDGVEDCLTRLRDLFAVTVAAALHEGGHMLAAWGSGTSIRALRLDVFGARMALDGFLSYRREWWIAAAGPLCNLLSAALVFPLCTAEREGLSLFVTASLGLCAVNLLPVRSLDGGRMLRCTVAPLLGERAADGTLRVTTTLFLGLLWMLSVYALLRVGQMLSLFVFTLCLLIRTSGGE